MNEVELRARIAQWEDLHTEFKLEVINANDLAATIVALANAEGGELIVGVSKERRLVGVGDPDKFTQYVDNICVNNCVPPITTNAQAMPVAGRVVVVIRVPKGEQRPYRTNQGLYYIRTSSGRRQATREELLRLFRASESMFYDETPLVRLSLDDIDMDSLRDFLGRTAQTNTALEVDPVRLLRSWRLAAGDHPTIAGIVLFGREPQRHLPFAQVNAARIPGTVVSVDPSDRKDLSGRLLDVIDQTMRFVRLHLLVPHKIRGLDPEQHPELPEEALREAIVNCVAHRDYTVQGPVRIFVFDDRVEFHTPGRVPNTIDEDAMRAGAHVVRNPHIYARLSDAGLVTRAGTGVPRIVRLVREATGQDVTIRTPEYEVFLSIPRKRSSTDRDPDNGQENRDS